MITFRNTGSPATEITGAVFIIAGGLALDSDSTGLPRLTVTSSGVGGAGTPNRIPKWTAGTTLGDSLFSDDGTDVTLTSGKLRFSAATSRIVPGATSLSLRNNADSADNILISDAGLATIRAGISLTSGNITFGAAVSGVIPGATSWAVRNNANSANNLLVSDAGLVTVRAGLTVTASDLTFGAASARLIPGATNFSLRNNANSADNILIADSGAITFRAGLSGITTISMSSTLTMTAAASRIVPGATSLSLRNNADSADNILIADAGAVTFRAGLSGITTLSMSGQLTNTVTTGTAPFVVSSTTKVTNLNADLLDGLDSSAFLLTGAISGSAGTLVKYATSSTLGGSLFSESGTTMTLAGHLVLSPDNTYDVGASGATRPRNIYAANSVQIGNTPATSGILRLPNNQSIQFRNGADTANVTAMLVTTSDHVQLGGTNSGEIQINPAGTTTWQFQVAGNLIPTTTDSYDLGSTTKLVRTLYGGSLILAGASNRINLGSTTTVTNVGIYLRNTTLLAASGASGYGTLIDPTFDSATTSSGQAGYFRVNTQAAAFTLAAGIGLRVGTPIIGATSAITNVYGMYLDAPTGGVTGNYGIYVNAVSGAATNNFVFYANGAGRARFADSMMVGTTDAGTNVQLMVSTPVTAVSNATQIGVLSRPNANNTATGSVEAFRADPRLDGSTPSVSAIYGLRVLDVTKTSGSITTQYGIHLADQTQGGTNYAIYSGLGTVRFGDQVIIGATTRATFPAAGGLVLEDLGSTTSPIFQIKQDDSAPWALGIQNITNDTSMARSMRLFVANDGTSRVYATNKSGSPANLEFYTTDIRRLRVDSGGDVTFETLGTFSNSIAPTKDYSLVYDGTTNKWQPRLLTLSLNSSGVVNAGTLQDGTTAQYVDTLPTLNSTTAVAASAPAITAGYRSFIVEFTTALNSATAQKYITDYMAIVPTTGTTGNSGTATSATSTTLTDSGKTGWTTDQWKGYTVIITGGTGAGQWRYITANNTSGQLTVATWTVTPDTSSTYIIGTFTHNAISSSGTTAAPLAKFVHSNVTVTPTTNYYYRYKIRGEVFSGTATAATSTTLTTTSTSPSVNAWANRKVMIVAGTGVGQIRNITSNTNGANSVLTVPTWTVTPDSTSQYYIDLTDYSDAGIAPAVSTQSMVTAFGLVVASQIAVQNLSSIVSSLGQAQATQLTVLGGLTVNPTATSIFHGPVSALKFEDFNPIVYRSIVDAASVTTTSITVTSAGWGDDMAGKWVRIISGTGIGQQRLITSVTNGGQTINWTTSLTTATTARFVIEARDAAGAYTTLPYGTVNTDAVQMVDGQLKLWGSSAFNAGIVARPDDKLNVLLGDYTTIRGGTTASQLDSSWTTNTPSITTTAVNTWASATSLPTNAVITGSSPASALDGQYRVAGTVTITHNLGSTTTGFVSVTGRVDLEYQVNGSGSWLSAGTIVSEELDDLPDGASHSTTIPWSHTLNLPGTFTDLSVRLIYYVIINATKVLTGSATVNGSGTDVRWTTLSGGSSYLRRGLSLRNTEDTTTTRAFAQVHFEPTMKRYQPSSKGETTEGEAWWDGLGHGIHVYNGKRVAPLLGQRKFAHLMGNATGIFPVGTAAPGEVNIGTKTAGASDAASNFVSIPAANSTNGTNASVISATLFVQGQHDPTITFVIRTPASYTSYRLWFGLTAQTLTNSQTPTFTGAVFRFLGGTDTQWQVGLGNNTAFSPTATGPTVAVDTVYFLRLRFDSANSRVYASVNDSAETELTTNFPTSTTALGVLMQSTNAAPATTSTYDFSYWTLEWGY